MGCRPFPFPPTAIKTDSLPELSYSLGVQLPDGSTCTLLRFGKSGVSGKPAADIWIYPAEITGKLQRAGIGLHAANVYLDFYKTFINHEKCKYTPYAEPSSFYYGDVRKIVANTDAFMEALEDFAASLVLI